MKQITITVDPSGNFTYEPAVLHVQTGDKIVWKCDAGPFAVAFKDGTPFEEPGSIEAHGKPHDGTPPLTVRGNARGHHHYAAAVELDDTVFLDAGCPDIIAN